VSVRRPVRERLSKRARWLLIGFAAFVAMDIALVWWAFGAGSRSSAEAGEPLPLSAFAPPPTYTPPPAAAEPDPEPARAPLSLEPPTRIIVPVDESAAWRSPTPACMGAFATIEHSVDAGATWDASTLDGVGGILAIDPYEDPSMVGIVAAVAGSCATEYRRSFTGGEFWAPAPDEAPAIPLLDQADRAVVHWPDGAGPGPCAAVGLASAEDGGAAVLCPDAGLWLAPAADRGAWAPAGLPGAAVAVAAQGDDYLVALRRNPACDPGLSLVILVEDGVVAPLACLTALPDESAPIALGTSEDAAWLWVGDATLVSSDGGSSWTGVG